MRDWLSSMGQTELMTRLTILGVVLFLLALFCCCSKCKSWVTRMRANEEDAPNPPPIAMFQPPTYEEALKKTRRRRSRIKDDTTSSDGNEGEASSKLLQKAETTNEGDIEKAGKSTGDENRGAPNTGDDGGVKSNLGDDDLNSSRDKGTSTSRDSRVTFNDPVVTDTFGNGSNKCRRKSCCGSTCNVEVDSSTKSTIAVVDIDSFGHGSGTCKVGGSGAKCHRAGGSVGGGDSTAPLPSTSFSKK